jgi:hypothetical protein
VRIRRGEAKAQTVDLATERGMVAAPRYLYHGRPADLAVRVEKGQAVRIERPRREALGALGAIPSEQMRFVTVEADMLPTGDALVASGFRAGLRSEVGITLVPLALLVLLACAAVAWGLSVAACARTNKAHIALAAMPALGIVLATREPLVEPLNALGPGLAGLVVIAAAARFCSCMRRLAAFRREGKRRAS